MFDYPKVATKSADDLQATLSPRLILRMAGPDREGVEQMAASIKGRLRPRTHLGELLATERTKPDVRVAVKRTTNARSKTS